eukprot:15089079-Ditylum_brightwellii.AAC.1
MANITATFKAVVDFVPLNMLNDANSNISHIQKELFSWHHLLGHVGFKWLQELCSSYNYDGSDKAQEPITCTKQSFAQTYPHLKYKICLPANRACCTQLATHTYCDLETEGHLKLGDIAPGNTVSTDQYEFAMH